MEQGANKTNIELLLKQNLSLKKENLHLRTLLGKEIKSREIYLTEQYSMTDNRLRTLQEISCIGVWELDLIGNKLWASPETFRIYGVEETEDGFIDIKKAIKLQIIDEYTRIDNAINDLIIHGKDYDITYKIYRTSEQNRELHYLNSKARLIKDADGKPSKIIGTIQDVTDRKRSEKELIKAKDKAEESDKLKSAFLANMSHEIRTPMNAIIGFSQLLNIGSLTPDRQKEYTEIIIKKGKLLITLIDDIIEVSKFQSGQLTITKSECNLNALMNELFLQFNQKISQLGKENIVLRLAVDDFNTPFVIFTDPGRLQQVIANLLSNAVKFTDKGNIDFGFKRDQENRLHFFVHDTGIGIPKDKLRVIFNRFRQVEETATRRFGGSGLGLTISKGIIELLGGKIWAESNLHKGSSFYFNLPLETVPVTEAEQVVEEPAQEISNFNWKDKVILVAEDEEVNYKFLETVLHETQAQVLHAENGFQVIELCRSINKIDLILMDMKMPEMNGFDAAREVKRINPKIPIIAQTAFSMKDDRAKCFEAGCDDYIAKPIDIKVLIDKIDQLFNLS